MTCYLRMHEALVGVAAPEREFDWDAVFEGWQKATTIAHRDDLLATMGLVAIDVYDLPNADLSGFSGLIISDRVDQEFLYRQRDSIHAFLGQGKALVFSGGLFRRWLPGGSNFVAYDPEASGGEMSLTISPHPIFEGLHPEDLGDYFAYGSHMPPEGSQTLVSLPGGEAVVYVDRVSARGTILVHAGHMLLGYGAAEEPARRMVPQLLSWIRQEVSR